MFTLYAYGEANLSLGDMVVVHRHQCEREKEQGLRTKSNMMEKKGKSKKKQVWPEGGTTIEDGKGKREKEKKQLRQSK